MKPVSSPYFHIITIKVILYMPSFGLDNSCHYCWQRFLDFR